MKRQTWFCLIVYLTLHTASVVRSEYTWNGSEWVWTESAVDQVCIIVHYYFYLRLEKKIVVCCGLP